MPTVVYIGKVYPFWKRGMLRDLVEPPWTVGLVDALLFYDQLEKVDELKREQREHDAQLGALEKFRT